MARKKQICDHCKEPKITYKQKNGRKVCKACFFLYLHKPRQAGCSKCHQVKPVHKNLPDGGALCQKCYRSPVNKAKCIECGHVRAIATRNENKEPICAVCRSKKNKKQCFVCKKVKVVAYRDKAGKPICKMCYPRTKKEKCVRCKQMRPVQRRNEMKQAICRNCARKKHFCPQCGEKKILYKYEMCEACYEKLIKLRQIYDKVKCAYCDVSARVYRISDEDQLCCLACFLGLELRKEQGRQLRKLNIEHFDDFQSKITGKTVVSAPR